MKTNRMWMKRAAMLSAIATCALGAQGVSQRKWEPGIKASDSEFWRLSKQGVDLQRPIAKDDATSDVARNVVAQQESGMMNSKSVIIKYDVQSFVPVNVSVVVKDNGVVVPATSFTGDYGLGVLPGMNKRIVWNAGLDYNNVLSSNMVVTVTAIPADNPSTWAMVTISWASFGGRDLDVCGYWLDRPDVKVGYSYGTGSTTSAYQSTWRGDNTGSGPEYINIGVAPGETLAGVTRRTYRIHCNYYGAAGSSAKATISVSCNGTTMSKTITTANRNGSAANTSDPYVTINFDSIGNLTSVN